MRAGRRRAARRTRIRDVEAAIAGDEAVLHLHLAEDSYSGEFEAAPGWSAGGGGVTSVWTIPMLATARPVQQI